MTKGERTNIAIGHGKGFITTRINKQRRVPSQRKGKLGKRTSLVRDIIRETVGFAPYEKRIIELLKTDVIKDNKKALRVARARLGTHRRALIKKAELENIVKAQKKKK